MKPITLYQAKDGKRFETEEACDQYERLPDRINAALATNKWIPVNEREPEDGEEVLTKIHDGSGARNQTTLKRQRNLWFFPDLSMYVYYRPTHWMPLPS